MQENLYTSATHFLYSYVNASSIFALHPSTPNSNYLPTWVNISVINLPNGSALLYLYWENGNIIMFPTKCSKTRELIVV